MPKSRWSVLAATGVLAGLLAAPGTAVADGAVHDPIPEDPAPSGLGLTLQEIAAFPKSEPTPPPTDQRLVRHARINYVGELPDRSGRKYVPDLNGKLYFLAKGSSTPTTYLDVGATFAPQFFSGRGMGQGFGFAAFHPDFARNGKFYTVHTELASATTAAPDYVQAGTILYHGVITEWTAKDPSANAFEGTRREVLRIGFGGQIHGIQQIDFNPTARRHGADYGKLYVAVGDGGQGVRNGEPQSLSLPHGKILRIDPSGRNSANGEYGVPADNPFTGRAGALGEIYALGMRDPHRFSWDRRWPHRLLLGHIGEKTIESVYEVRPGANLGWSEREGTWVFDKATANPCDRLYPLPADDAKYGYTYPLAMYDHNPPPDWNCTDDVGHAISGGFVYRGARVPALRGKYVFGDIVDGRVFFTYDRQMRLGAPRAPIYTLGVFGQDGRPATMQDLGAVGATGSPTRVDLRFGTDAAGELYLLAKSNGKVWKVTGVRPYR
ncbi:PQQ-dependent sugar dehydrogenase [Actinomadura fibrosa]|uniref:PQQ-dependent sugar dehydrogenase n=1 Tax=Actinomadura fibrosa TaxID=111802 RepID=A0ABW2XB32_9ACTN|nr:PQQ-dependent sugar dehydrogenase [Actinomadura fibrosa]